MNDTNQKPNWVQLNAEWESSGLSQQKFCDARLISYSMFTYERGKLLDKKKPKPKLAFSGVKVAQPLPSEVGTNLILRLPTGMRLEIPPSSDLAQVKSLLVILGIFPC